MHSEIQCLVYNRHHSAFGVGINGKVECRAGKAGNLPGAWQEVLFARATNKFSVFTHVIINLSKIYYNLQMCIIFFNINIFIHENYDICSDSQIEWN